MACRSCLRHASGLFILLGIVTALVLPAAATTLNGTLTFPTELGQRMEEIQRERAGKLRQHFWRVPNGAVPTRDLPVNPSRELLVSLAPVGEQPAGPAGQPKVISLQGATLNPGVVVVTPHTKVRFRNDDVFVYELRCAKNKQMVRTNPLPPGNQVDYPFEELGIYEITDRRLPHIVGWVVVENTARTKNPQPGKKAGQASFSFEDVQAGNYNVKIFYAGAWVAEQQVEVPEEEEEVGVQITVPAAAEQPEAETAAAEQPAENAGAEAE